MAKKLSEAIAAVTQTSKTLCACTAMEGLYGDSNEIAELPENFGALTNLDEGSLNKNLFPGDFPEDPERGSTPPKIRSVFRGVSWCEERAKWTVCISAGASETGKTKIVGRYPSEVKAARAYDESEHLKEGSYGWKHRNIAMFPGLYLTD